MLPESQLDRFMVSPFHGLPGSCESGELLRDRQTANPLENAGAVITKEEVVALEQVQKTCTWQIPFWIILPPPSGGNQKPSDDHLLDLAPEDPGLCRMTKAAAFYRIGTM